MQGAAPKDKTKISAPVPKSDAATAEQTTKHSQGTAQYSKDKLKSSKSKKKTQTQTTWHTKTSRTLFKSRIHLLKRSEERL